MVVNKFGEGENSLIEFVHLIRNIANLNPSSKCPYKETCWSKDWVCPHLFVVDPHIGTIKCVYPNLGSYYEGELFNRHP